jgi:hypothetical protein
VVQPPDHLEVLEPGQVLVDGRVLPREPDPRPELARVADDVEAGDARLALVGGEQRREDADCRRLPGAVRPEETEDAAGRDDEVDAAKRLDLPVPLDQPAGLDRRALHVVVHSATVDDPLRATPQDPFLDRESCPFAVRWPRRRLAFIAYNQGGRMRTLLAALALSLGAVVLAAPAGAAADADKVRGHVDQGTQIVDFSATSNFNGTEPRGTVKFTQPNSDPNTVFTGTVTCLSVVGNTFQATGPITAVRNNQFPGFTPMSFVIQGSDGGKFGTAPDTFSGSVSFFNPPPLTCAANAAGSPVVNGDIVVEDGQV